MWTCVFRSGQLFIRTPGELRFQLAQKKKKTAFYSNSRWLTLSSFIFYE